MRLTFRLTTTFAFLFGAIFLIRVPSLGAEDTNRYALGAHSLLFLRVEFAEDTEPPASIADIERMLDRADRELRAYSYGAFWLNSTVRHLRLPQPRSFYDPFQIYFALRDATREAGLEPDKYQTIAYYTAFFGNAHAFTTEIFLPDNDATAVIHELGHVLRLAHANSAAFPPGDFLGEVTPEYYGNVYDMMGYAHHYLQPDDLTDLPHAHFNSFLKHRLGWLPSANVATAQTNGIYSLAPIDHGALTPSRHHAIRIARNSTNDFWIELRVGAPGLFIGNGVLIMLCASTPDSMNNFLIDTTPGSEPVWKFNGKGGNFSGNFDAALPAGRSLTDPQTGILIAPLGWKDDRFDVYIRLSGTQPPPAPYYDGLFTWARPDFFPSDRPAERVLGYNAYFSPAPGKHFTIEDSEDFINWHYVTDFYSTGAVVHLHRELSTFAPRFFRARPSQ